MDSLFHEFFAQQITQHDPIVINARSTPIAHYNTFYGNGNYPHRRLWLTLDPL